MRALIVGIDPGTTVGYALLDTAGHIVKVGSEKNIAFSDFILKVYEHGTPILAGTDKKKTPAYIENFSAKTGARICRPKKDLLKKEKKQLAKIKTANDHEEDALAAATMVWEEYRDLFSRVERFLEKKQKQEIADELKTFLMRNEELNIAEAYEQLTKPPKAAAVKIPKKREKIKPTRKEIELENELVLVKQENKSLKNKLLLLNKIKGKLKAATKNSEKEIVNYKEQRIKSISKDQKRLKRQYLHELKEQYKKDAFISQLTDRILIKKLNNLGKEEFDRKNKLLDIKEGDVLLVDNPNIINRKVYDFLKSKVKIIICRKAPTISQDFLYVDAEHLNLDELENYASVSRAEFEQSFSKKDLLKSILADYKKERAG